MDNISGRVWTHGQRVSKREAIIAMCDGEQVRYHCQRGDHVVNIKGLRTGEVCDSVRFLRSDVKHFSEEDMKGLWSNDLRIYKPEQSCNGKIVEIEGKKYKLTEV